MVIAAGAVGGRQIEDCSTNIDGVAVAEFETTGMIGVGSL